MTSSDWITYDELLSEVLKNIDKESAGGQVRPHSVISIRNRPVSMFSIMTALSQAGEKDGIPSHLLSAEVPDYSTLKLDPNSPLTPEDQFLHRFKNQVQTRIRDNGDLSDDDRKARTEKRESRLLELRKKEKEKDILKEEEEEKSKLEDWETEEDERRRIEMEMAMDVEHEALKGEEKQSRPKKAFKSLMKVIFKKMGVD